MPSLPGTTLPTALARVVRTSSDHELASAIVGGDRDAWEEAFDRHAGVVFGLVLRMCGDPAASSVVESVFVDLWREPESLGVGIGAGPLGSLLQSAAHRRAVVELDRRRAETPHRAAGRAPRPSTDGGDRLTTLLARVPAAEREVVELAYFEGLTCHELAARLGRPTSVVTAQIRAGLTALRAAAG